MARRIGYSVRRLASGRWQALVRAEDGKQVGIGSWATQQAADRAGQQAAVDMRKHLWIDPRSSDIPLGRWIRDWLERKQAIGKHGVKYAEDCARMLRLYIVEDPIGRVVLTDLRPAVVSAWYDRQAAKRIAAKGTLGITIPKVYRMMHACLEDAVRDQMITINPCMVPGGGEERSEERPILEPGQVIDVAEAIHPRWRAMVLIAGWCGLRLGELAALRRQDINLLRGTIDVSQSVLELSDGEMITKGPKTSAGRRTVIVPRPLVIELERHLELFVAADPEAFVFTGPKGGQLRRSNFSDRYRYAAKKVGLPTTRFHDLRHHAATVAVVSGATEREVMARLGHRSSVAARRYQHLVESRGEELAERIGLTFSVASEPRAPVRKIRKG